MSEQIDLTPAEFKEFSAYFEADLPRLTTYARSQVPGRQEAEDVVQEAMLAVLRSWRRIDNPEAYARGTVKNIAQRRRATRSRETLLDELDMIKGSVVADDDLSMVDLLRVVRQVLATLPDKQREVMALTMDGHTDSEIAQQTGQSPATVRSNRRHAREKIAGELNWRPPKTRKEAGDG